MQVNRIEVRMGATVNVGDFQSIKTEVMAQADVERNEDPMEAYTKLAGFVQTALVEGARVSHPDQVRLLLKKDSRLAEAASDAKALNGATPPAEPAKNKGGRPKKEAVAPAAPETAKLADTTGLDIGGLDKEDALTGSSDDLDELDNLLGDAAPETPVTKDEVQNSLTQVMKKCGKPALLELLKKHGANNLSQLAESAYNAIKREADTMAAKAAQ